MLVDRVGVSRLDRRQSNGPPQPPFARDIHFRPDIVQQPGCRSTAHAQIYVEDTPRALTNLESLLRLIVFCTIYPVVLIARH